MPIKMIAPKGDRHNPSNGIGLRSSSRPVAHTLPTSHVEDPDLALIVGLWNRLADECKQRLIEIVRANLPTEPTKGTTGSEK
jgi:hypothetical protein